MFRNNTTIAEKGNPVWDLFDSSSLSLVFFFLTPEGRLCLCGNSQRSRVPTGVTRGRDRHHWPYGRSAPAKITRGEITSGVFYTRWGELQELNWSDVLGVWTCKAYTTHTQVFLKGGLEKKQRFSAVSEITSIHTTHFKCISHDHSQTFYLNNASSHLFSLLSIIVVSVIIVHLCLSKHRQYNIQSISVKTQIFQYHNIQLYCATHTNKTKLRSKHWHQSFPLLPIQTKTPTLNIWEELCSVCLDRAWHFWMWEMLNCVVVLFLTPFYFEVKPFLCPTDKICFSQVKSRQKTIWLELEKHQALA